MGDGMDARQTVWSDPGRHGARVRELSDRPGVIADRLELFVLHHEIARHLGFGVPEAAEGDRGLRRVEALLDAAFARDARVLTAHRDIKNYLYVTCRDFAMLAVSALRAAGIAARLRVGFAGYFQKGRWIDHLVCEYRLGDRWAVLDAQLGPRAREGFKIDFPVDDVPARAWLPAAEMWLAVRAGEVDPEICGLPSAGIKGLWWCAGSVMRDAAALAGVEALPWDFWGPGVGVREARAVPDALAADIDLLAAALVPAPLDRAAALAVLGRFPWVGPGDLGGG